MRIYIMAVSLVLFLTGCAPKISNTVEPVAFSVLYNERKTTPFRKDWRILEEYKKQQNVSLNVSLGDDSDYEKYVVNALEGGDPPDIILKVWPQLIESYANSGLLLAFSDYENRMPNFLAYIKKHNLENELDKLRLDNGKYYILPGYQRKIQVQQWIYRKDVFEQNNLSTPTSYDELFNSLVVLKKLYPQSIPITTLWGGAHLFAMMGAGYGITAGWTGSRNYNVAEDRWQFSPATENYRAMYKFLSNCYSAGLLDPSFFTQSDDEFYSKLLDGRAFVTVTWISSGFDTWNSKLKENGIFDGEWVPLPVLESTVGIRALPAVDPFRKGLVVPAIVANQPYFNDLIKFLDWAVYSDEGRTLSYWGIEGLTYETTPTGKAFLPNIKTLKNNNGIIDISDEYGFDSLFNLTENELLEDYKKPAEITTFLNRSLIEGETAELNPLLNLNPKSIEIIRLLNEKLDPYVEDTGKMFITGEMDIDKDWSKYLSELQNRGYNTLEIIWNGAWEHHGQ